MPLHNAFAGLARRMRVPFLAASLSIIAQVGLAQSVTLTQAYDRMLSSEVELQILGIEADIAAELVRQAKGQRYPRVSLSIKYASVAQNIISSDNTTFQNADSRYPKTTISFSVIQPIFDQVRWRAKNVAEAEQALTAAQAEVARNQLTNDLVRKYLDVAVAQYGVNRAKTLVAARTQLERALELQIDAGRGDASILTRAQGDTFAARSDQADAELNLSNALFELYRYTGPGFTSVNVGATGLVSVSAGNFESTFSEAQLLANSPELQVAKAQVFVAQKQLDQVRAGFRPTANLTFDVTSEQTSGSLFGGGSNIATGEVGIGIGWSIYEGGIRASRKREAEARIEMATLRVTQTEDFLRRQRAGLIAAIKQSNQRANAVNQQLRTAEQAFADAQAQEEAGRVGIEVTMENRLRRDLLRVESQSARLRTLQLQAQVFALFGALDTATLSGRVAN